MPSKTKNTTAVETPDNELENVVIEQRQFAASTADIEAYMNSLPPIEDMHSGKEETIVDRRIITLKGTFLIAK
jgi:hypothetical protein